MRAPISIIIPTLNAERELPGTLGALSEGLAAGLIRELVISDGNSQDATQRIAEDAGATLVVGAPGRGSQLRRGAGVSTGQWLLFLHADTRLAPGWVTAVVAHLEKHHSPACFHLRFDAPGRAARLVAGWANLRTRLFSLPYGDQALLVRRDTYDLAGGYRSIALMEDVALMRALPRVRLLPATAETDAATYLREGWLRRGALNLSLLLRFFLGSDPNKLARSYHRKRPRR